MTGSCAGSTGPSASNDLAAAQPEKVRELTARWDDYVKANNVVLPNRSPFEPKDAKHPPPEDPGFPPLKLKRPFVPPADMLAEPKP